MAVLAIKSAWMYAIDFAREMNSIRFSGGNLYKFLQFKENPRFLPNLLIALITTTKNKKTSL